VIKFLFFLSQIFKFCEYFALLIFSSSIFGTLYNRDAPTTSVKWSISKTVPKLKTKRKRWIELKTSIWFRVQFSFLQDSSNLSMQNLQCTDPNYVVVKNILWTNNNISYQNIMNELGHFLTQCDYFFLGHLLIKIGSGPCCLPQFSSTFLS
jgi:hypothetical protein